jgi:hypothetical protein
VEGPATLIGGLQRVRIVGLMSNSLTGVLVEAS